MYDHVLVPTDGSAAVEGAIAHAVELAETYGATVHALYAVQPLYAPEPGFDRVYTAMEEEGETAVETVAERARDAGLVVETAVRRGEPHQQIVEYAADHGVDLIAMGTHGRTGLDRYLVGSVTEKVVRTVEVPVLTVRHVPDSDGDRATGDTEPEAVDDLPDERPESVDPVDPADGGPS